MGQPQQGMLHPKLSPDGRRVAVDATQGGDVDIWVHDVDRPLKTRMTFDPGKEESPVWSPSGKQIAFTSNRRGNADLFTRAADGSGLRGSVPKYDVSADGQRFVIIEEVEDKQAKRPSIHIIQELVRRVPRPPAGLSRDREGAVIR